MDRLLSCLSLRQPKAALVRSNILHGEAAHASGLVALLRTLPCLCSTTFYDFELFDPTRQADACAAVSQHALTHLSFQNSPVHFYFKSSEYAKTNLDPYTSIALISLALKAWTKPPSLANEDWSFPKVESEQLYYPYSV